MSQELEKPEEEKRDTESRMVPGRMRVGWATDTGQVRGHNEDAVLVMETYQEGNQNLPPFGLFVLADGMGGHRSGELASTLAVRVVASYILQHIHLDMLTGEGRDASRPSLSETLIEAVNRASAAIAKTIPGSGTTVTCAVLLGRHVYIADVGDSRAYLISSNGMEQITRDHTLVDRLVELGQITLDEAAHHPQKNVLYRAVGQSGMLEVDTFKYSLDPGSRLLLCTDGLWGLIDDAQIRDLIGTTRSPQEACESLARAANEAGGRDNISAILIELPVE